MATTEETKTGNGTSLTFTIPYIKPSDIKIKVDGGTPLEWDTSTSPSAGKYHIVDNTSTITFGTSYTSENSILIYRDTNVDSVAAIFSAGSSIRAKDLNAIHDMARFAIQEEKNDVKYTTAEQSKLSGIATGAEVNVQSDWNASSGDAQVLNKPTIPTNNNQLTNGAGFTTNTGTVTSVTGSSPITVSNGTTTPAISIDLSGYLATSHAASGVTSTKITNWDTAHGWGNHASAGYLTSIANDSITEVKLDIHNAPSNDKVLGYTSNGLEWVSQSGGGGIALSDISVTSNSAGTAALSYNNSSGVFSYTPPDLSGYSVTSHNHDSSYATSSHNHDSSYNNYTHPTTAGNIHIPSGGSAGQFLKYSASGTAVWAADNNTTYTVGDGGLTQNNFTNTLKTKLDGIETSADVTDATNVDSAGAIMNSDLDGKGEILIGDGSGDPTALAVGTNTHVLTADSNEASGVKWAAVSGGSSGLPSSPSVNQMIRYDGSEWVTIPSPSGSSGKVLAYSSSTFSWASNLNVGTINLSGHLAEDTVAVADTPDGNGDVPLSLLSGSILTWTLGANRTATFTGGYFSAGRSALLMVACGSNTLTWPSNVLTWVGGSAPTLATSGYSCIEFWTQATNNTKIYACYVGDVA